MNVVASNAPEAQRSYATPSIDYYAFPFKGDGEVMGPFPSFELAMAALDEHAPAGTYTICRKVMNHSVFRLVS